MFHSFYDIISHMPLRTCIMFKVYSEYPISLSLWNSIQYFPREGKWLKTHCSLLLNSISSLTTWLVRSHKTWQTDKSKHKPKASGPFDIHRVYSDRTRTILGSEITKCVLLDKPCQIQSPHLLNLLGSLFLFVDYTEWEYYAKLHLF